jgi:hypothetical protein
MVSACCLGNATGHRAFDGFEDLLITGAPAQIPRERLLDLIAGRAWMLVEERLRRHKKAGRAVTTLRRTEIGKRLLQWVQASVGRQPFDRRHFTPAAVDAEHKTRQDRLAIEQHGARAALAELAPVLRAAKVEILTQDLEQRLVRRERHLGSFAVDRQSG